MSLKILCGFVSFRLMFLIINKLIVFMFFVNFKDNLIEKRTRAFQSRFLSEHFDYIDSFLRRFCYIDLYLLANN